eukprot:6678870-Alexandrium_andersonii.AAC.1
MRTGREPPPVGLHTYHQRLAGERGRQEGSNVPSAVALYARASASASCCDRPMSGPRQLPSCLLWFTGIACWPGIGR